MNHIAFSDQMINPSIAVLIKSSYFDEKELREYYERPLQSKGIEPRDLIAFELQYPSNKVSISQAKEYLSKLMPMLKHLGVRYLYVADATYFKALTGLTKAENQLGYVKPCSLKGYEYVQVIYGINYGMLLHHPEATSKLDLSLQTLTQCVKGNYLELGQDILHHAQYPETLADIENALEMLLNKPILACDLETFSLSFIHAHIGTIAFAWDKHSGIAFKCDYSEMVKHDGLYAQHKHNAPVHKLLKRFFERYKGKLIFHNASYDVKVLIYNLFMKHERDYEGMLYGLNLFTRHLHDTKIIAYLALNTTARQSYSLKDLSHEYAGNYALSEINDIRKIPSQDLLKYNLIDCLCTQYLYEKYYPSMCADNQENIYNTMMLPTLKTIIYMELCGMPIHMNQVNKVADELEQLRQKYLQEIHNDKHIQQALAQLKVKELERINANLKTKQHGLEKVADYEFNPNSNAHLQHLLYKHLALPVVDYTDSKQPATGSDTLEKLKNHADEQVQTLLDNLIGLNKVAKILDTFIPALQKADKQGDWYYLHGSFNLGGTISGRLSSSNPNLQNMPSGSEYAKLIKSCFSAPDEWLMVGADFSSLEAKINALLTNDQNKLSVYTQGMDSHSFNAYGFWKDKMPLIKQAQKGEILFSIVVEGVKHYLKGDDLVNYKGRTLSVIELMRLKNDLENY